MTELDFLRDREIGGILVEASGSEEAAPSTAAPSAATGPAHHTRRSRSAEEKAQIVAESDRPGAVQKEIAARHSISGQTLRHWRSRARAGDLFGASGVTTSGNRPGRRWPDDVKAQIVAESQRPGASISAVALRHGISEKTVRPWRRRAASGDGGERQRAAARPYIPCPFTSTMLKAARRHRFADKAYDAECIRMMLQNQDAEPINPDRSNAGSAHAFSQVFYRLRNRVEHFFHKLKQFRRTATPYEKLALNYLSMIKLATTRIWLNARESTR